MASRQTSSAKAATPVLGPSPELSLLAEVVQALTQLVDLGLLAFQVRAVLLEAAGQRAGALLDGLQVLLHLPKEGLLLGLQLGGQGLRGGEADVGAVARALGLVQHCPRCLGHLLWGKGWKAWALEAFAFAFLLKTGGHFCSVPFFVIMNKTWENFKTLRRATYAL